MQRLTNQQHRAVAQPQGLATTLVTLCLLLAFMLSATPSYADGGASNRKEAISQALARSGSDAEVLGVKQIQKNNGRIIFAVKVISNGRVKVIHIPKTNSE